MALGLGLVPAWAGTAGHYEAILCHCRTQAEATKLRDAAERLGYTAVIQVIHPNDIEVELVNALQTKSDADRFCTREQPKLSTAQLHCHAEQEMHGIPSDWTHNHGPAPAPSPQPTPIPVKTPPPPGPVTTPTPKQPHHAPPPVSQPQPKRHHRSDQPSARGDDRRDEHAGSDHSPDHEGRSDDGRFDGRFDDWLPSWQGLHSSWWGAWF